MPNTRSELRNWRKISAENAELKAELAKLRHDFDSRGLSNPSMLLTCRTGEEEISEVTVVPQPDASHDIPDPVIDQP